VDAIPGTGSDLATRLIRERFGVGTLYQFPLVVHADSLASTDPEFGAAIERLTAALSALPSVSRVESAWNSPRGELMGDDGRSALVLVTPHVETFYAAELLTASLRAAVRAGALPAGMHAEVTGATAMLHDLDEHSSSDLLTAERVALPITAVILCSLSAPARAPLPILLALASTSIGLAGLYLMSTRLAVSVFARMSSMIGLASVWTMRCSC
jgi:RND superfamily putative drug exporter